MGTWFKFINIRNLLFFFFFFLLLPGRDLEAKCGRKFHVCTFKSEMVPFLFLLVYIQFNNWSSNFNCTFIYLFVYCYYFKEELNYLGGILRKSWPDVQEEEDKIGVRFGRLKTTNLRFCSHVLCLYQLYFIHLYT